jgi:hypothetical protein
MKGEKPMMPMSDDDKEKHGKYDQYEIENTADMMTRMMDVKNHKPKLMKMALDHMKKKQSMMKRAVTWADGL